jgi:two-component system osmolarity sensor histidine kinase EnvZ
VITPTERRGLRGALTQGRQRLRTWLQASTPSGSIGAELGPRRSVSLFWRTFFFLAMLLLGSIVAWLQTFRALESGPRAIEDAQQLASLVNLSRASLRYSDAIARISLIKTLADQEGLRIALRQPDDRFEPFDTSPLGERITKELNLRLGSGTLVARSVNGEPGFWVGFSIEDDAYWLQTDAERFGPSHKSTWMVWLGTAGLLSLSGAAVIAGLINRPLKQLSVAAGHLREGRFDASLLDESAATTEIRDVNIGFNRMAEQLSKMEHDRAIMLAGISHDLRTPLARLRLETEMSVADDSARAHMAADISQLDAIIDKFLDYARPQAARLDRVSLNAIVKSAVYAVADYEDLRIQVSLPAELHIWADEVELLRVLSNLLENARRYGKSAGSGKALVDISASASDQWVLITVSDRGRGVPADLLLKLTRPFFRADASRADPTGSGLGLAIAESTITRMGGAFWLSSEPAAGLAAHIKLRRG